MDAGFSLQIPALASAATGVHELPESPGLSLRCDEQTRLAAERKLLLRLSGPHFEYVPLLPGELDAAVQPAR